MKIKLQYDVEINNQYHTYYLRIEYIKTNSIPPTHLLVKIITKIWYHITTIQFIYLK